MLRLFLFLSLILTSTSLFAERLKVGLVLSGGGARGAAHVGVLKVLEENNIPIDYIAGTSMGSIVGGLYASGKSAEEIEAILYEIDWEARLTDTANRRDQPLIRKQYDEFFSVAGQPGIKEGEILLPQGLIQGQQILPLLQALTQEVAHIDDFSELPIPFHAVATDIVSGQMVVLKHGDLARALRASMAVPSAFAPVSNGDMLLVDGGLTNNLPVDIVKDMGAEIIIAVDISTPYRNKDQITNLLHITDQMTNMLTGVNTQQRRSMLEPKDILIEPELGDISSADFDRAVEAIPIGEAEANAQIERLKRLTLARDQYLAHVDARPTVSTPNDRVNAIHLNNDSELDDNILLELIDSKSGDDFDIQQADSDVYDIHALGNFESVSYRLHHTPEGIDLYFDAAAKSWGPNYLYFGFDMEGDLEGDTLFDVQLGYSREEINSKGGIWTTIASVGSEPGLGTTLYQPLTRSRGPFLQAATGYHRHYQAIFDDDADKVVDYRITEFETAIGLGWEFSPQSAITLGIDRTIGDTNIVVGARTFPEPEFDDGGVYLHYRYDSYDDNNFPSSGSLINLWARTSLDSFGADDEYDQWQLDLGKVFAYKDHRFIVAFKGGSTSDDASPIGSYFQAGGGPTLMGLDKGQLLGTHIAIAQFYYYREFQPAPFLSGYIGTLLEYGGAWFDRDDINADNSVFSGSIFTAIDTPIGPMQFGIGATDGGEFNYFTRIGHLF